MTSSMRTMWLAMSLAPLPHEAIVRIEDEFIRNYGDLSPFTMAQNRYAFHEIVSKHEKANPRATASCNRMAARSASQMSASELAQGVEKLHICAMQRWGDKDRFDHDKAPRYTEHFKRAQDSKTESRKEMLARFTGKEVCRNCLRHDPSSPLHFRSTCDKTFTRADSVFDRKVKLHRVAVHPDPEDQDLSGFTVSPDEGDCTGLTSPYEDFLSRFG